MISSKEAYDNWVKRRAKLLNKGRGKQRLYDDTEALEYAFQDYIENCIKEKKMPTLAGYTVDVFNNPSTRKKYERDPDFADLCAEFRLIIEDLTINSGKVDGSIRKLIMQSRFDYAEKQEQIVATAGLTSEELEKYKKELKDKYGVETE